MDKISIFAYSPLVYVILGIIAFFTLYLGYGEFSLYALLSLAVFGIIDSLIRFHISYNLFQKEKDEKLLKPMVIVNIVFIFVYIFLLILFIDIYLLNY
ncbi:hypothetical protein [Methanobrevibacter sp. DSM 116169]|uniref:hypothetical protein n=1 Tax=Methanobrevibacter sp. DSM 116169 TaxID=3242727 RepID=UPI0038FC8BF6